MRGQTVWKPAKSVTVIKSNVTRSTYGKTEAIADLKRSLPANTEAEWAGYAMVMYIKMLWKFRNIPGK